MRSWWGKSSSKNAKKKPNKESIIDTLQRKFKNQSEVKGNSRSGESQRHCNDTASEKGSQSRAESRSPSPSKQVARCQSFNERPHAQPLPPPLQPGRVGRTDSGIGLTTKPRSEKGGKLFLPLPRPACIGSKGNPAELDGDLVTASVSTESSIDGDDPTDSSQRSPQATDFEKGSKTTASSTSSVMVRNEKQSFSQIKPKESRKPTHLTLSTHISPTSPRQRPLSGHVPNLQVPYPGAFYSAPDSSLSSPSRSPIRAFGGEHVVNSTFWNGKHYADVTLLGSGQCSSPGSGHNSGHNSMGGDMSGQLFWQQSRGSPEYSPIPSPRISPGPSSRIQSGAVTPIHPRSGGTSLEPQTSWPEDVKQQSHRLPLPPVTISNSSPFSHSNSPATSPSVPRSPGRSETPTNLTSRWKKGRLIGRGTFGHVYVGFNSFQGEKKKPFVPSPSTPKNNSRFTTLNLVLDSSSENGEMCAMKEVTLFSDDAKSKESAKQLMQEITLLSRLQHPNIVQYFGSETVDDKLYIYLEYVSGGSIYKILQEYGQLGEVAIRSYTQQILSGLAYLHAKNTVHRDIKGANILVDPNGRVKLADFGMAKHITGQSCPLSFKGSPYWMAPEVIRNANGCNIAVDIWSLGCTVLEMATTKPPWSQFEGVAAMFKIGNSKELPAIPDHLSEEGKDFVRCCLKRNPQDRLSAAQLLEHPFVKLATPLERPISGPELTDPSNTVKPMGIVQLKTPSHFDPERLAVHSSRIIKPSSDAHISRNISCPVSPIGSPLLHARSPQHFSGRMSPSPISSPRTASGSCTPLTGGTGAIPFHHIKQSIYLHEGFGSMPKSSNIPYINGTPYHDLNSEIFRGVQPGLHTFPELPSCESEVRGMQFVRPSYVEMRDGQSVLADCVSRQLRDHVKVTPSLDLCPSAPLPSRSNGL